MQALRCYMCDCGSVLDCLHGISNTLQAAFLAADAHNRLNAGKDWRHVVSVESIINNYYSRPPRKAGSMATL